MQELMSNHIVHGAIVFAIAFLASRFLYRKDEKIEDRRRIAGELAMKSKEMGLTWVPELLLDYSVGDYDAIGAKLVKLRSLAHNDAAFKAEVHGALRQLISGKLNSVEGRKELAAIFEAIGVKIGVEKLAPAEVPVAPQPQVPA